METAPHRLVSADQAASVARTFAEVLQTPPAAQIEVRRLPQKLKIARLDSSPFVERLVRKFQLPVDGWRRDLGREIQTTTEA